MLLDKTTNEVFTNPTTVYNESGKFENLEEWKIERKHVEVVDKKTLR